MTKLKLVGFALVFSFGLGACGSAADDIKKLAKEACACTDKACGEAVNKKIEAALEKIESESEAKEAIGAMGEAAVCLGKLGVD